MTQALNTFKKPLRSNQQGFTIIELMISLSILSLILLLSTYSILQLGSVYSKGTNMASTQNTTRNLVANIGSQLQLGGATATFHEAVGTGTGVLCIGSQRYSFVLNHKLTNANNDHVLWHDVMDSSSICTAVPFTPFAASGGLNTSNPNNGTEMMPLNSRLVDMYVSTTPDGLYAVNVAVAYGDNDVLNYTARPDATHPAKAVCNGGSGDNFCAVSSLEKIIDSRITQ